MRAKTFFFAWTIVLLLFAGSAIAAEELPRAQLDEAERHFTEGYNRFLALDHWGALDYLDRALRANTYLVDHYIMKGLVMNRTGDYAAGREALEYYLEVRPMDLAAPRILSYAIAQQRGIQRVAGPTAVSARWRVSKLDLQNEIELGYLRPFSAKGLGKGAMWEGSLYLADTFGDSVFYRSAASDEVNVLPLSRPAAVLPMGDDSFYVVTTGGEVYFFGPFEAPTMTLSLRGTLENTSVSDAAFISENEFVIADPVTREIAFYSLAGLAGATARTGAWSPPDPPADGPAFFEPRAVASYGSWLAVADRGGDEIFFLNLNNRREFFSAEAERPRDVVWSRLGELFVINDSGELLRLAVDFRGGRVEATDTLETGVTDGWTLFTSADGDVYCMDISGSALWKAIPLPDDTLSIAALTASAPRISRDQDRESFILDATFMSPFKTYTRGARIVTHAVWNNRTISALAWWNHEPVPVSPVLVNRPAPPSLVSASITSAPVDDGLDIRIVLPSIWTSQDGTLTNLIVDSTVDMTPEDIYVLTLFCMNNGVELDIWARGVPSTELTKASGLTGGKTVYSIINPPVLTPPGAKIQIRIPLPQELSSSGYPSRSMLSLFLDVGLMHTRDWMPLWPDLI